MQNDQTINDSHLDPVKFSRMLYYSAWIVEIIVVIAGFCISIVVALDAFEKVTTINKHPDASVYFNSIIAFIPFFLVSVVELTKIPVAGAVFFTKSKSWKLILSIMLLSLIVVSFETSLNGFQRNYTQRTKVVENYKELLVPFEMEVERLEAEKQKLKETTIKTIETNYNKHQLNIADGLDKQLSPLLEEKRRLQSQAHNSRVASAQEGIDYIRGEVSRIEAARKDDLHENKQIYSKKIGSAHESSAQKSEKLNHQISLLTSELNQLKESRKEGGRSSAIAGLIYNLGISDNEIDEKINEIKAVRSKLYNITSDSEIKSAKNDYDKNLVTIDTKYSNLISTFRRKLNVLLEKKSQIVSEAHHGNIERIQIVNKQIDEVTSSFKVQKDKNDEERTKQLERLNAKRQRIDQIDSQTIELEKKINHHRSEINKAANGDQIYQIAKMLYTNAKNAADITPKQAGLVAIIWFGSLAFIVAVTGVLLAFASFVISEQLNRKGKEIDSTGIRKLNDSLRRFLVTRRKLIRQPRIKEVVVEKQIPVEVVKEIPVEKVVINEVTKEVPVDRVVFKDIVREVIKKEIVHIPLYTNDPKLVNTIDKKDESTDS